MHATIKDSMAQEMWQQRTYQVQFADQRQQELQEAVQHQWQQQS